MFRVPPPLMQRSIQRADYGLNLEIMSSMLFTTSRLKALAQVYFSIRPVKGTCPAISQQLRPARRFLTTDPNSLSTGEAPGQKSKKVKHFHTYAHAQHQNVTAAVCAKQIQRSHDAIIVFVARFLSRQGYRLC